MDCASARKTVSAYLDRVVSREEASVLERHLNNCDKCALETESYSRIREKLRSLSAPVAPPDLTTRLRVVGSKVRMERGANAWQRWRGRAALCMRDVMRPVALPAVGGL